MPECFVVQPIHQAGIDALEAAGITVRRASAQDMETVAREIGNADAVITRDAGLNAAAMDAAPGLKLISNHGIGINKIDVAHATALDIPISFTPTANAISVAEHALMLMLVCAKRAVEADAAARKGDFRFKFSGGMIELSGKVLGIAGLGTIGRHLARMAKAAFGMRVVVWSPSADPALVAQVGERVESLDALLAVADVLSLHRPARPDTRDMINAATLAAMKPGAILINTARGALIDEAALAEALKANRIRAAGLDVFEPEPIDPATSPLVGLPNIVLAPHVAGSTEDALKATALACAEHVIAALKGEKPSDLVDPAIWDRRRLAA
ncbi:MAG TPA: hydroxyacid dehydrogenase [Rhizobiaceae bacterium]|nr:hydroxyacid dehydrogenase [Rhizobiaceae bacterium]